MIEEVFDGDVGRVSVVILKGFVWSWGSELSFGLEGWDLVWVLW